MYPALVAMDCMALFSSMVISEPRPILDSSLKREKERMTEVTPTPRVQPVMMPIYRLVRLRMSPSPIPVRAERMVS